MYQELKNDDGEILLRIFIDVPFCKALKDTPDSAFYLKALHETRKKIAEIERELKPPRKGSKKAAIKHVYSPEFEEVWLAYPSYRRVKKVAAYAKWKKLIKNGDLDPCKDKDRIIKHINHLLKSGIWVNSDESKQNGEPYWRSIKMIEFYLSSLWWQDEIPDKDENIEYIE